MPVQLVTCGEGVTGGASIAGSAAVGGAVSTCVPQTRRTLRHFQVAGSACCRAWKSTTTLPMPSPDRTTRSLAGRVSSGEVERVEQAAANIAEASRSHVEPILDGADEEVAREPHLVEAVACPHPRIRHRPDAREVRRSSRS